MPWLSFVISSLGTAMIVAVMAIGVVLVYRTSRVLTFHVGEVGMFSSYILVTLWQRNGGGEVALIEGLVGALVAAILIGFIMYFVVERLGMRLGHFIGTVVTIAASIFLIGLMSMFWQARTLRMPFFEGGWQLGQTTVPIANIAVVVIGAVVIAIAVFAVTKSRLGIDMQAVANNPELAALRGVPVSFTLCAAWVGGSILAAISGILFASVSVVSIEGSIIGLSAIVAAILGGLTSIRGCILGALLLAFTENFITIAFEPRYSQVVPVLLLLVLLIIRPSGLSGKVEKITRV